MRHLTAAIALCVLAACHPLAEKPTADHGWIRLAAVSGRPAATYFTMHGGQQDDALLSVSTPIANKVELHESMKTGGDDGAPMMMTMKAIRQVAVPAGETVKFAPGGRHAMLFDVSPKIQAGDTAPLTLHFASGTNVQVSAKVIAAGDPAPKG